jgi:hypothetical protein
MPSSPRTPTHRRRPSNIDIEFSTPNDGHSSSRRHSKASVHTPTTPHHRISRSGSIGIDIFSGGGQQPPNGLGNLADELAEAWDDDEAEEDDPDMNFQEAVKETEEIRDSGIDVAAAPEKTAQKPASLTPPGNSRSHRRKGSEYDGSDYGEDSDMDSPGIPPSLVSRMDMVESLARRGTESNGTDRDGVVHRVVESLKDLGGQSGVEGGATR